MAPAFRMGRPVKTPNGSLLALPKPLDLNAGIAQAGDLDHVVRSDVKLRAPSQIKQLELERQAIIRVTV